MDKDAALEVIAKFRESLESKGVKIEKLVLFGSYAEGTNREGSDIDLMVISNSFIDKSYWERIEILSEAIYEVFEPIEAIAMTPDEWEKGESPIAQYSRNGEVVYAA